MPDSENPCLSLAIARLANAGREHFAIWVLKAPYPAGYVHHDCNWPESLTQSWLNWQQMFKLRGLPHVPLVHHAAQPALTVPPQHNTVAQGPMPSQSGRLMQEMGINLWHWLFDGPIDNSLAQSYGIAMGRAKPLRLRLELRDPNLIPLPWEIMQEEAGKPAISLGQQVLFSRTTSDVEPLPPQRSEQALNILLVLGEDAAPKSGSSGQLKLKQEALTLTEVLENASQVALTQENFVPPVPSRVETLVQPTPAELIKALETGNYNILFYGGHGVPAPDGGSVFLCPNQTLNGTELAQVLVRCRVKLAVFNACWGAQPEQDNHQAIPRSSLAEVLIHHGVPAVLGMRDSIADDEALSFIQTFAQALAARMPVDQAVAVARQQLLTLYKFNQPAWTLPVLYMHPEFNGDLIQPLGEVRTDIGTISTEMPGLYRANAYLRVVERPNQTWPIRGGIMRVGRGQENDVVIQEQWVSQKHAEVICRDCLIDGHPKPTYFLRDFSRFGTLVFTPKGWEKVNHQEVLIESGVKLKFGSSRGQTLEFIIDQ